MDEENEERGRRGRRGSIFDVGERTRTSALSKIQMGLKGGGGIIGFRLQVREAGKCGAAEEDEG